MNKEQAKGYLKGDYIKPGTRMWMDQVHVTNAGWRYIKVYVVEVKEDGEPYIYNIAHLVAPALGLRLDRDRMAVRTQEYPVGLAHWIMRDLYGPINQSDVRVTTLA